MKIPTRTSLALFALSLTAFGPYANAQSKILRETQLSLNVPGLGAQKYKIEIETTQTPRAQIVGLSSELFNPNEPEDQTLRCHTDVAHTGAVQKFTLRDENGAILDRAQQNTIFRYTFTREIAEGRKCLNIYPTDTVVDSVHPSQFINLNVNGMTLTVTVPFAAKAIFSDNASAQVTLNPKSISTVNWYFNNDRGSRDLIDPANPPTPSSDNNNGCDRD
jgi:hypothetical protein